MASPIRHHLPLLLLLALSIPSTTASSSPPIQYADLCASLVPESPLKAPISDANASFSFNSGHFIGADEFLGAGGAARRGLSFRPRLLHSTSTPGTIGIEGMLTLRSPPGPRGRSLRHVVSIPRFGRPWGFLKLELSGFWSEPSGWMCLVGSGVGRRAGGGVSREISAVFKLNCTRNSDIWNAFVVGRLESLDAAGSSGYFGPVSMMVYVGREYEYSLLPKVEGLNAGLDPVGDPLRFGADHNVCFLMKSIGNAGRMKLVYGTDCRGTNCSPFCVEVPPGFVILRDVQCDKDGRLHLSMLFLKDDYWSQSFDPAMALVGEGFWDGERSRFVMVACHLRNLTESGSTGSVIGDCGIGVSLWFPRSLSIKDRSLLVGRIWSHKSKNDSGYFETISVHGSDYYMGVVPGLKYNFTKKADLGEACLSSNSNKSAGKLYPDRSTFRDLTFSFSTKDSTGEFSRGSMSLFSIGETIYDHFSSDNGALPPSMLAEMNRTTWNVSYKIIFNRWGSSLSLPAEELSDISAEGVYNLQTGVLCLIGCRKLPFDDKNPIRRVNSTDCEMVINVQLPSVDRVGGEHITGGIRSMRQNKDPLFFKSLEISSHAMYHNDVVKTKWRMNVEITLVLISLTLSCIFIALQHLYVRRNPDVISEISPTMLLVLTLGHMIPLMLNYDAMFFRNRDKQNVLLSSGGWLEGNEVIVRIMTMVAFLLQLRLLQITWSARLSGERKKELWTAEKKSIKICLPLYFVGIIIAWLFNLGSHRSKSPTTVGSQSHDSLWGDLIVFSGLVLDGFLLPQIFFNVFWDSKEKPLSPAYYIGTTAVQALPHLYDVYRAHSHMVFIMSTYVYASPKEDFFSTAWDIFIPFGGIVLMIIIYLQQRFGGQSILPSRFRNSSGYKVVPIASG